MTAIAKHVARKPLVMANATKTQISGRNKQLRELFPARHPKHRGAATAGTAEDTLVRLTSGLFASDVNSTQAGRRRGVTKLLDWLATFPGDTWQQRWELSGVEQHPGKAWNALPLRWLQQHDQSASYDANDLSSGMLAFICGDVIRPGLPWMLTRTHTRLAAAMAHTRDPDGFAQLKRLAETQPASSAADAQVAATRIATILGCKGGHIVDITVGDCVELVDTLSQVHARGGQKKVDFYLRLRTIGIFPEDAPHTIRAFGQAAGQLTIEELVDRYPLRCRLIRDLLVDYLRERQPSLDFASVDALSRTLAGLFWARIEAIAPGIDTLQLPPDVIRTWKDDLANKKRMITNAAGEQIEAATPRLNVKDELLRVRAFYLDIAQWAVDDPARWAQWVAPCPIGDAEIQRAKDRKHRKARMDQRTRDRLPVLPMLVHTAIQRRRRAQRLLQTADHTSPGALILGTDAKLRRAHVQRGSAATCGPMTRPPANGATCPTRTTTRSGHSPP